MEGIGLKLLVIAFVVTQVLAQNVGAQQAPDASQLVLPGGAIQTKATPLFFRAGGDIQIVVQLADPSLAAAQGRNAKQRGARMSSAQQRDYLNQLGQKQD